MTTPEELLEGRQPSPLQLLAPLAALILVIGVVVSGADSQTVWYVIRATGVIAYVLLALSVIVGLLVASRAAPAGRLRVDLYEVHAFTSLVALAFAVVHAVTLLLDNFVSFSPVQILIPFTSSYRPFSVSLGIVSLYLLAIIYGSFWARRVIGYRRWRLLHYATFGAFVLVTLHGILSGADARTPWMILIVASVCAFVFGLTIFRVIDAQARARKAA